LSTNIYQAEMTDRSSSFFSDSSSLASDYNTKVFGSSARLVHASEQYAEYGFIAVLGLAQRLHVRFLPITWQAALDQIGKGGQARINEALVNVQTSFAFKLFNRPQQHPLSEIAQEMVVLSHPMVRKHEHIVTLEGICWDIPEDDQVWPVLVFQKSHLGDLYHFAKLERFKDLSIEERLNLCADIGIAIRDMHRNGNIPFSNLANSLPNCRHNPRRHQTS
jgi:Protein tyrosine and serine/threonine kinase